MLFRIQMRFLWVHFYDAHGPYLPRGSYADLFHSESRGPALARIPRYQRVRDRDP